MNVDGSAPMLEYLCEEIVDPDFSALKLPSFLETVRAQLFGSDPDRYMLNYRCHQLLALTHATPLAEYLIALDSRITYDWRNTDLVSADLFQPKITQLGNGVELKL